jgi:hypothetical protein
MTKLEALLWILRNCRNLPPEHICPNGMLQRRMRATRLLMCLGTYGNNRKVSTAFTETQIYRDSGYV